ncbi:hypothetical protein Sjap_023504 [Stephania japonica]|uniref:Uncharacterized protein n=1 Tax=Stephania japonica TaxID=461633 RepID=A0AAP0HMR7_9MAGN
MAVLLGNLTLSIEGATARPGLPERKPRPVAVDLAAVSLPRPANLITAICASLAGEEVRGLRVRGNSKPNAVDFDANWSDEENGNGSGLEEEEEDWEQRLRQRLKELEEMKELEKKAEELQSQAAAAGSSGGGDGDEAEEETEEQKRLRVRKELEKVAKEQAERRETAELMFELGQRAYGKGAYSRSIEFLEAALTIIPKPTLFGGEIQIWLAMAYEANKRHADCIALYKQLETKHPSVSIRRQAADLRYILQAPKLKISQDEMVSIPLIGSSYDRYAGTWTDKNRDRGQSLSGGITNQLPSTKDYLADFLVWKPPAGWEKNRIFWISLTLWLGLVGTALILQK